MGAETATSAEFVLPSLGSDMDAGTVIEWLVQPGAKVHKGDVLLRVDTEKSDIDVEIWHDAEIVEILAQPGETVAVGTALARLAASATPRSEAERSASRPIDEPITAPRRSVPSAIVSSAEDRVPDTVRPDPRLVYWPPGELATEAQPATARAQPVVAAPVAPRADRRQAAVAALMEQSNREIPHFHLSRELDVTDAMAWLERVNATRKPNERVLPAALLLYTIARAAAGSAVNGPYDRATDDAHPIEGVDLGVAVHVRGGGLMTPVLPKADTLDLDDLMAGLRAMVGRTRSGRLSSLDLTPATLTVTNLGDSGADQVLGIIRPPQRALVAIGRIAERPVVVNGAVEPRRTTVLTLSADHRVVNGHAGARFIDAVAACLDSPEEIKLAGDPS